jgi:hypothetical protein
VSHIPADQSHSQSFVHSFIHSPVCLTTGPWRPPKSVLHTVKSSASSLKFQYPLVSVRSSSSCLRLLLLFSVTSTPHSITCFRRQSLNNIMTDQVSLPSFYCMYGIPVLFDSKSHFLISHTIGPTDLHKHSPVPHI